MVMYMIFTKNAFSKLVFELETSCKDQKNCKHYANSMVPFLHYSDELPVKNAFLSQFYSEQFYFLAETNKNK